MMHGLTNLKFIYNYLTDVYIKLWQHVSVVHSTIIRP